jgi:cold shock CspA family protein
MRPQRAKEIARRLPSAADCEHRGVCKWYDPNKGFGFITPEVGPDVFLHETALLDPDNPPTTGDHMLYSVGRRPNGKFGALSAKVI